jgi:hypothetical protein
MRNWGTGLREGPGCGGAVQGKSHMRIYKIQNRKTKLFKTSGRTGWFTKTGKVWASASYVKRHINMYFTYWKRHLTDREQLKQTFLVNCDVVEYEVNEISRVDATEFYLGKE